jgi:site-specific recombinase XerD
MWRQCSVPASTRRFVSTTTARVRRHRADAGQVSEERFTPTAVKPAPPPEPAVPPRPLGDLSQATAGEIASLAHRAWKDAKRTTAVRRRDAVLRLLEHLHGFDGHTWQQRWEAAGLNESGRLQEVAAARADGNATVTAGAWHLFCMRVVRPSLPAFRSIRLVTYPDQFRRIAADPLLDAFFARVDTLPTYVASRRTALFDVTCALTVFGIGLADLTPPALLHYAVESRRQHLVRGGTPGDGSYAGGLAWTALHQMGHFPASTPHSLRAALTRGQRTIEDLVDRYQLRDRGVRDLLVDYLRRRSVELDYSTTDQLARILTHQFWQRIETVNPDQAGLRLDEATYQQWKTAIAFLRDGRPRIDVDKILLAVRSFYLDLHTWAAAEPERWAAWAAPCPVRETEVRRLHVSRRRANERMADRTRVRQPLLPVLVAHVTDRWTQLRELLAAAQKVPLGERFTAQGATWQRMASTHDQWRARTETNPPIRVLNRDTGQLLRLTQDEDAAFWDWAVIETLRHAGLRAEELAELTHLSIRQYQRPGGQVVALLVVAPSKSDRERVIPMSAELFHVIAQVIRRHTTRHGTVPVATRYDLHEKVWNPPLPYLFQRQHGVRHAALAHRTIWQMLQRRCTDLAATHPEFAGVKFSPHDFRRLFATELVNAGLPIHIGAALLGHLHIQTTRGYLAVFDEQITRHYQEFLDHRRTLRPTDEYRTPTPSEWGEFEEHFDKRRVELGSCQRPYGTPCAHEHACIRCPMLSIDPKMLARLDELEADLVARRARAETEGWRGETEGIDLTLTFLRSKRAEVRRAAGTVAPLPVQLGTPAVPPPHDGRTRRA